MKPSKYPYTDVLDRFAADVTEHQMTVLHDDGLYRHVRFQQPENSWHYRFDLITWPGHLVIDGDMGSYTFARIEDMFDFFNSATINPGYWGQKLQAHSGYREYSEAVLAALVGTFVEEHIADNDMPEGEANELRQVVQEEVLNAAYDVTSAHQVLAEFRSHKLEFTDSWELNLTDYVYQFLWCCAAIRWGIEQYKAAKP